MPLKFILSIAVTVMLAGCAGLPPGVKSVSHDVYSLSIPVIPAQGGLRGAEKIAWIDAGNYCRNLNREMIFLSMNTATEGTLEMIFRCPSIRFPNAH